MSRARGTGSIFRKPGCNKWTIQYYVDGRRRREATGTTDYSTARRLLNKRLGQAASGEALEATGRPAKVQELWDALFVKCQNDGRGRGVRDVKTRWLHLARCLRRCRRGV